MVFVYTNLKSWERNKILELFGLELRGSAYEPLKGIKFDKVTTEVKQNNFSSQDIVLCHERNSVGRLSDLPWERPDRVLLILHNKKDINIYWKIARQYPPKKIFFRFEPSENGAVVKLLRNLSGYRSPEGRSKYYQLLEQFHQYFETHAIQYLTERIVNDNKLFGAKRLEGKAQDEIPYLWKWLFNISPESQRLIRKHTQTTNSQKKQKIHEKIYDCLVRDLEKSK